MDVRRDVSLARGRLLVGWVLVALAFSALAPVLGRGLLHRGDRTQGVPLEGGYADAPAQEPRGPGVGTSPDEASRIPIRVLMHERSERLQACPSGRVPITVMMACSHRASSGSGTTRGFG